MSKLDVTWSIYLTRFLLWRWCHYSTKKIKCVDFVLVGTHAEETFAYLWPYSGWLWLPDIEGITGWCLRGARTICLNEKYSLQSLRFLLFHDCVFYILFLLLGMLVIFKHIGAKPTHPLGLSLIVTSLYVALSDTALSSQEWFLLDTEIIYLKNYRNVYLPSSRKRALKIFTQRSLRAETIFYSSLHLCLLA